EHVDVGGVDEGDAEIEGPLEGGDRVGLDDRAVGEVGEAHAAEPLGGHGEAGGPEGPGGKGHWRAPRTMAGSAAHATTGWGRCDEHEPSGCGRCDPGVPSSR